VGLRGVVCTEKSNQLTKGEKKIGKITYLGIQWKIQHFLTFLYTFSSASLYAFSFVVVVISLNHNWFALRFYVDLCVYNIYFYIAKYLYVYVGLYICIYIYVCSIPYAQMNFPFSERIL